MTWQQWILWAGLTVAIGAVQMLVLNIIGMVVMGLWPRRRPDRRRARARGS